MGGYEQQKIFGNVNCSSPAKRTWKNSWLWLLEIFAKNASIVVIVDAGISNPKSEIRMKPEIRIPKPAQRRLQFGLRASDFLRISRFGFRIYSCPVHPWFLNFVCRI